MLIKIWYPNDCHSSDFLCFLFMNYQWAWEMNFMGSKDDQAFIKLNAIKNI